jgi:hypothetical protein
MIESQLQFITVVGSGNQKFRTVPRFQINRPYYTDVMPMIVIYPYQL